MRADRLLSIVLLLQLHRRLTARTLAERLEVSERTIHRDMESLSAAGVPVVAARGARGGWSLPGAYRTNLTGLNEAEVRALFVTNPPRLLADLKLDRAAEGALLKLLAALPAMHRRGAERVRRRIHVDVAGWRRPDEAAPLLPVVQEAVFLERRLRMRYRRDGAEPVERLVDPLGLVAKGSVWYLAAGVDGEVRSYRVSRIEAAEPTDEPCASPEDFDLAAFWKRSTDAFEAHLPQYRAAVRARPDVLPRLRYAGRFARIGPAGEPGADGRVPVTLCFDTEEMACEYVLAFGPAMEVVDPPALRERVLEAARSVVAFYEGR